MSWAPPPAGPPSEANGAAYGHDAPPVATEAPVEPAPRRRRARASTVILSTLLALVVLAAGAATVWLVMQLQDARDEIDDQRRQIEDQRELIDEKEQFGAAVERLYDSVEPLLGLPYASLIPWSAYDDIVDRAWADRWNADALKGDTARVDEIVADLEELKADAAAEASINASGTRWEATLDALGDGWVTTSVADAVCGTDALACVASDEPFLVHIAAETTSDPTMTDWIRTGVAYHEYAHVLQYTNPEATETALEAFDGDMETMADCYALTYLDGWTLRHEVRIDAFSYWIVNVGYGYTCDDAQRQVIRDWIGGLGIEKQVIGG